MKQTHINPAANPDGTRNVVFLTETEGYVPAGRLMPEVTNHVPEQPTSKYVKMLTDRSRTDHDESAMRARRTQFHA